MALKDVKEYYYNMLSQYLESKEDLIDFETALKDGHITEDQLIDLKEDVGRLKENLDRVQYILFLFNLPNRKDKKKKYKINNSALIKYFKELKVDTESINIENDDIIAHIRAEINKLKK